jgi:hypothetical protein
LSPFRELPAGAIEVGRWEDLDLGLEGWESGVVRGGGVEVGVDAVVVAAGAAFVRADEVRDRVEEKPMRRADARCRQRRQIMVGVIGSEAEL